MKDLIYLRIHVIGSPATALDVSAEAESITHETRGSGLLEHGILCADIGLDPAAARSLVDDLRARGFDGTPPPPDGGDSDAQA
jgi:hypothetical protein